VSVFANRSTKLIEISDPKAGGKPAGQNHHQENPQDVQQYIPHGALPTGDESLVIFVQNPDGHSYPGRQMILECKICSRFRGKGQEK
jgi:hypothetical protein